MGQKAKNAGKKVSKTCDRHANVKSNHCKGSKVKHITLADYTSINFESLEKLVDEHSGHTRQYRYEGHTTQKQN